MAAARRRSRLPGGLVTLLLGAALSWAAAASYVEPVLSGECSLEGRSMEVERAALLVAATAQVCAPAPRARTSAQPPLALLAYVVGLAQAACVDAPASALHGASQCAWLRVARRLPRSDCSEPDCRS